MEALGSVCLSAAVLVLHHSVLNLANPSPAPASWHRALARRKMKLRIKNTILTERHISPEASLVSTPAECWDGNWDRNIHTNLSWLDGVGEVPSGRSRRGVDGGAVTVWVGVDDLDGLVDGLGFEDIEDWAEQLGARRSVMHFFPETGRSHMIDYSPCVGAGNGIGRTMQNGGIGNAERSGGPYLGIAGRDRHSRVANVLCWSTQHCWSNPVALWVSVHLGVTPIQQDLRTLID